MEERQRLAEVAAEKAQAYLRAFATVRNQPDEQAWHELSDAAFQLAGVLSELNESMEE